MSVIDLLNTNLLSKRDRQNKVILKVLTQTNSIQEISNKNNELKIKLDKTQFFKARGEAAVKVEILKNKQEIYFHSVQLHSLNFIIFNLF